MMPARNAAGHAPGAAPSAPELAAEGLLERPLSARSVMASLLLGMHPPRIRGALLVRWCAIFGIAPGTARVALHRMVGRGELAFRDGVYELSGPLASRQRVQDWSLEPQLLTWDGTWRLAVVTEQTRAASDRQALRDAMRRLRFADFREGVWLRPDNLPRAAAPAGAKAVADAQCQLFHARSDPAERSALVARFDPEGWAARARELTTRLAELATAIEQGDDRMLAHGFVTGAAALTHVRSDPLLPEELTPSPWPGPALRDAYHSYRAAFADATARWFARSGELSSG